MKTKNIIIILGVILISHISYLTSCFAQPDIHFSQFYMSPLTENPALAGASYGIEGQINYKDQWKSLGTPYKTTAASVNASFQRKKKAKAFVAGGLNFFSDKAGDSKMGTTQINLTGACHVSLDRYNKIGGGLQVGFAQRSVDYTNLTWGNQFDGKAYNSGLSSREVPGVPSYSYADVGAGVVWSYSKTTGRDNVLGNDEFKSNVGISLFHITQPKYSFTGTDEKLKMKFVAHGNALLNVPNSTYGFAPGFMYFRQGSASELYVGTLLRFKLNQISKYTGVKTNSSISFGGYYRSKDAVILALLLEYSNYAIGMSYDVNTSGLSTASASRGGFEISLRYIGAIPFIAQSSSRF